MIPDRGRRLYERSPRWVRETGGLVVSHIPSQYRYGSDFREASRFLHGSEAWSRGPAEVWQSHRLADLLTLAASEVPYYRDMLRDIKVPVSADEALPILRSMPLLTTDVVREFANELCPSSHSPGSSRFVTTGGTSGRPLGFRVSYAASAVEWAFMLNVWRGVGVHAQDRRLVLRGTAPRARSSGGIVERDALNRALVLSTFDLTPSALEAAMPKIARFKPVSLHAYPSSALLFGEWLASTGNRLPELRRLLLGSENLYSWQRHRLVELFGVPVYSWYGHSEKCVLAPECLARDGFHPYWQYGVTELVSPEGLIIDEPGVEGVIVGTGFINRATLLIRYVTDDRAQWAKDPCGCGRWEPRLRKLVGRWDQEYLVARDSTLIPMAAVNLHSPAYASVTQFQFHQEVPGSAVLKIVRGPRSSSQSEAVLLAELDTKLRGRVAVTIEHVSSIPLSPSGKFKFIDQRLDVHTRPATHAASNEQGAIGP